MRLIVAILVAIHALQPPPTGRAQGWVAEIDIEVSLERYAGASIVSSTLTYSGNTLRGRSPNNRRSYIASGTSPISGSLGVLVRGLASEPRNPSDPPTQVFAATYSGWYDTTCEEGVVEGGGNIPGVHITIRMRIYPRSEISGFHQDCEQVTLTSNTCFPSLRWEIRDESTGGFKTLEGKTTSTITVSREDLVAAGVANPLGRKYFRVTGVPNTASTLQPVDIYFPGPTATVVPTSPLCHNGTDGSIDVTITSLVPAVLRDFVVTLFDAATSRPLLQEYLIAGNRIELRGIRAGAYIVRVENNTGINFFGACWTDTPVDVINPEPVRIRSAQITDFNGSHLSCAGAEDGAIAVTAAGGTGVYEHYQWTPAVSTSDSACNLAAGTYRVRVRDSNECWSSEYRYTLTAPEEFSVTLSSSGGRNGFEVSCHESRDGSIETRVRGGTQPYRYWWSDGLTTAGRANLSPGLYQLTVADANNCSAQETITLTAPEPISFTIREIAGIACFDDRTGALEITSVRNTIGRTSILWNDGATQEQITGRPAGRYTAIVSDEQGCSAEATMVLREPEPIVLAISELIMPHCPDECNAAIKIEASGGTGTLDFEWSNGGRVPELRNLCDGEYALTARDENNCTSTLTQVITNPRGDGIELGGPIVLCEGQSHILDPGSTWETFTWGSSNGTGSTEQVLTISEPGTYWLEALDQTGCTARDTFMLTTTNNLVNADFLVASAAFTTDTLVIIDISWPIPETVHWTFPEGMDPLNESAGLVYGRFSLPGDYEIILDVASGGCRDRITKVVSITNGRDRTDDAGRVAHPPVVRNFSVYPNPNEGVFEIVVAFVNETPLHVTVLSGTTSAVVAVLRENGRSKYHKAIDLRGVAVGLHTVRLEYPGGTLYRKMIIR